MSGRPAPSPDELRRTIAAHNLWVETGGRRGEQARLQDLDLRNADLREAQGLTASDFAGSDLTGAKLPEAMSGLGKVDHIAAVSGIARPLFLFLLLSTTFVLMTVFSTPDVAFFSNATSEVLPNLSIAVPAASLFWVAPVILLMLYVYVHFYIAHIWDALAELPAVYPDGTPVEEKAHPWLFVRLVRLRDGLRAVGFEEIVLILLLWGAVPATLLGVWWRYLPLRDWPVTLFHVVLVLVAAWEGVTLFQRAVGTLMRRPYRLPRARPALRLLAGLLVTVTLLFQFAPEIFNAYTSLLRQSGEITSSEVSGVKPKKVTWIVAHLEDGDLQSVLLRDRDLRYAFGHRANLAEANLTDARLTGSDFQRGSFRRALLEDVDLRHANLDSADFDSACLRKADFEGADLEDASFRGAYLGKANLRNAYLTRAQLQYANLQGANLRGADLSSADLEGAVLYCYAAHRNDPDKEQVNTCVDLADAVLHETRLHGTDLRYVNNLTQEQLDSACGQARLPDGLTLRACPDEDTLPVPSTARTDRGSPDPADNPCLHEMKSDFWIPEDDG